MSLRRPVLVRFPVFIAAQVVTSLKLAALGCCMTGLLGVAQAQESQLDSAHSSPQPLRLKADEQLTNPASRHSERKSSTEAETTSIARKPPVFAQADKIQGRADREVTLEGSAQIRQAGVIITAERMTYSQANNELTAIGSVRVSKEGVIVIGREIQLNFDSEKGFVSNASYSIGSLGGRGFSDRIEFLGQGKIRALAATYTTCEPKKPDWLLRTESLDLDQTKLQGRTAHTQLFFKDQQLASVPFFFFPIGRERQSGFLAPSLESNSRVGLGGTFPYYFNLAPNRDATVATRLMSRRGLGFETEFRFLEDFGQGQLKFDFNPKDTATSDFRFLANLRSELRLPFDWNIYLGVKRVSDDNYLADYGRNLVQASETRLPAEISVTRNFGPWQFNARAITWQHLLEARQNPNYDQLPQFRLTTDQLLGRLRFELTADASKFQIDQLTAAAGWRTVVNPAISYPIQTETFFLTPKIGLHASRYQLERNPLGPTRLSRSLPTFSLDAGMTFERDFKWRGENLLQTLEPRLFYVKTPFKDQSRFPVFADTAAAELNFAQLFSDNSFVGNDRIADLSQLTAVLVTRIIDPVDGSERLRLAGGQRLYFSEQRVTLSPLDPPRTDTRSDLLFTVSGDIAKNVSLDAGFQYSVRTGELPRFNASLRYWPSRTKLVNFSYRFSKANNLNQVDTSWRWQVSDRWSSLGRLNYSFAKQGTFTLGGGTERPGLVEAIIGTEYDRDCWAFRGVVQRFVTADRKPTTQLFLQLELKGLGQIGVSPFEVLRRNIPGYRSQGDRLNSPNLFFGYD